MTNDSKALSLIPQDLQGFTALAKQFSESKLIPSDLQSKPADVFVTLLAGHELGLSPMAALRGIHVVKGKTILSADTMAAVVLASGACEYFRCVEATNERAIYETKRKGSEPQQTTWSMADAATAKLTGDNWTKYPRAMLKARCKAELARDVYPDVLAGCYVEGEIPDDNAHAVTPISIARVPIAAKPQCDDVIDAEVVERPASTAWVAFVADLAIANLTVVNEDDVAEAWARALEGDTRAEIDTTIKGMSGALAKHKSDYRVAALRERVLTMYRARMAEFKRAPEAAAS